MRTIRYFKLYFLALIVVWAPHPARAFNSAAHLYIAEHVYPDSPHWADFANGSIAPDFPFFLLNENQWPMGYEDTHRTYTDLLSEARHSIQEAFADGWLTHNELWGADHYAHIETPFRNDEDPEGYVIQKMRPLIAAYPILGFFPDAAHAAVEAGVDLLLKDDDPLLGQKLSEANSLRSWLDLRLLESFFIQKEKRTGWIPLIIAESRFRDYIDRYAAALAMPAPEDKKALTAIGMQLAEDLYGVEVDEGGLLEILETAMELCRADYKAAVDLTIEHIRAHMAGQ